MIDESRENSEERDKAHWHEMRPATKQNTKECKRGGSKPTYRRNERSPIHRNRGQQEQSPIRAQQPNTQRTPRIPRDPNRYSPLRYAYQDTPYREPQYRRDFISQGPQGETTGTKRRKRTTQITERLKPPQKSILRTP